MTAGNNGPVKLLMLNGDGIGPEITGASRQVLAEIDRILDLGIEFVEEEIGLTALRKTGTTFPDHIVPTAKQCDGIVLGPVSRSEYPPISEGGLNPSGLLRIRLGLFGNMRPSRSRKGIPPRCGKELDLVIARENTEGFYADRNMFQGPGEFMPEPDVALSIRKITRGASLRIAEAAFKMARTRRKKVTVVTKANVLRVTDGLFRECVRETARANPDIEYDEKFIDAMSALLVRDASQFDVVVTTNMFGDILSDLASEIAGSLGLGSSLNVGVDHAAAQAQHGSAPDIAGQDLANPVSLVGSAAMLLEWIGERRGSEKFIAGGRAINRAIDRLIENPQTRTRDLGGPLGTKAFTSRLVDSLEEAVATAG